ncbi:hypothetical protein ACKLJN_26255 [Klebsiella pneumoniae]|uniref:hypothetical protein n=1 Tax=Klebsiella pneumoniae TaxID=573 RepID=UPI003834F6A9
MENAVNWRTESRTVYSSDFKLRMVELASLPASPTLLSVDVINDPLPAAENDTLCTFSSAHASATSCHVEFRHGKMTLENPSSELLTVLIRELTGRTQ